jgi:hypothetical protein
MHGWCRSRPPFHRLWREFDDAGNLKDPELRERVKEVGRQVARFAYLHGSCEANEFLQKWEKSLKNPGGEERYDM